MSRIVSGLAVLVEAARAGDGDVANPIRGSAPFGGCNHGGEAMFICCSLSERTALGLYEHAVHLRRGDSVK